MSHEVFTSYPQLNCFDYFAIVFLFFFILIPAFLRATQGTKGLLYNWAIKYGSLGNFRQRKHVLCT